jgi:maleate isomerase
MVDALGWRLKLGVVAPSTNTVVQPEFDAMRPPGVTNHFGCIHIPNDPLRGDDDFTRLIERVRRELMAAVDRVNQCRDLSLGARRNGIGDRVDGFGSLLKRH